MALRPLTDQERAAAREKAKQSRQIRATAKQALKNREITISEFLQRADADEALQRIRVEDMLKNPSQALGTCARRRSCENYGSRRAAVFVAWGHTSARISSNTSKGSPVTETQSPKLTVLAGPTAVGKGTVSAYIRDHHPEVWLSISATTRDPRRGEEDGVHYYFVSDEEFDSMVDNRQMLEWAKVHNNHRYGTMKRMVLEALDAGRHVLLEIDIQGARQVRNAMPEANMIFLAPPSWEELVRRLRTRGTETDTEQQVRLETAKEELASEPEFDVTVVNETVEKAAAEVLEIMGISSPAK